MQSKWHRGKRETGEGYKATLWRAPGGTLAAPTPGGDGDHARLLAEKWQLICGYAEEGWGQDYRVSPKQDRVLY